MKPVIAKGNCRRGLNRSPAGVEKEEEVMEYQEKSELQLSHVSRGAQKLTQMIESLSNAPNLNGPSRYIADDLMQGALDLQESLIMLRKLQEASSAMTNRRRNPRLDAREERERDVVDVFGYEAMGSRRFAGSGRHDKLQEQRLSVDGSTRNCVSEMKKVIKDSLVRQNLSMSSDDEKMSSCSSRSLSFAASCSFEDLSSEQKKTVASISSNKQPKAKSPSLIAKLMGLEEVPSETVQPVMKEEKKSVTLARPGFDIVMPKAIKLPSAEQFYEPKQKSLQEIIETMQLKGLLKHVQVNDDRTRLRFSDTPQSEQFGKNDSKDDKSPPIVIMKPINSPYWERGEANNDLFGKPSMKKEICSGKTVQEKKSSLHELMLQKTFGRKEVKRTEKTRVESFQMDNTVSPEFHKQPKKDGSGAGKKTNTAPKPPLNRKKEVQGLGSPNSQVKTASVQQAKPDKKLSVAKSDVSRQRSTPPAYNLRGPVRPVPQHSISPTKEKKISGAKSVRKSAPVKAISNTNKLQDGKASGPLCAMCDVSTTSPLHNDDLPKKAEQERKPCNRDDTKKEHNVFHEGMPQRKMYERLGPHSILPVDKAVDETTEKPGGTKPELPAEAVQLPSKMITVRTMSRTEEDMRWLLLSSQSFLSSAKVFGIDPREPTPHRSKGLEEVVTRNAKLFVECGNELLASKSHQREILSHPLTQAPVLGQTLYTSLDQLVEEISNDIEQLNSYIVVDDNATPENSLSFRLEKDLKCNETSINSMWDIDWMNHTYIQESDQVVSEVEEYILSFLVEEMVKDFVL